MMHYGFGDTKKLLATPVATFWMLHKNIDRLLAEKDMRTADIAIRSQGEDGVKSLFEDLRKQMGTVVDLDKVFAAQEQQLDRASLQGLKGLGKL